MMKRLAAVLPFILLFESFSVNPSAGTVTMEEFKNEFLERINTLREHGCRCGDVYMPPVKPVVWNGLLQYAASVHAKDMARNNYFSHTGLNGQDVKNRINGSGYTITGYQSLYIGENIAQGQRSIREVMRDWINSSGHCKNLMDPHFKEVGVAMVKFYWVQDFGGREPFIKGVSK